MHVAVTVLTTDMPHIRLKISNSSTGVHSEECPKLVSNYITIVLFLLLLLLLL